MSEEKQNNIQVAVDENSSYVKIIGRATFSMAPDFKSFVEKQMELKLQDVWLDLKKCESLDSTFIGVITNLTIKYSENSVTHLKLLNLSEHLIKILKTLGLLNVLTISNSKSEEEISFEDVKKTDNSKKNIALTMLEAHEMLSSLNEKNALEFKNVVEYLRKEVN